jgi:signal transduction histidine kinase
VVVGRVVDELRAANPDREIRVEAPEGEDLAGPWDPDRLEQVASNLVSNAVDHGDPGTPVRVELAGEDRAVSLTVRNAGPGLPPEVMQHLFEPFSRPPDEQSRKASGLGLGLFICREIVRGHGGDISAHASEGAMAVTVRLPRGEAVESGATSVCWDSTPRSRSATPPRRPRGGARRSPPTPPA